MKYISSSNYVVKWHLQVYDIAQDMWTERTEDFPVGIAFMQSVLVDDGTSIWLVYVLRV